QENKEQQSDAEQNKSDEDDEAQRAEEEQAQRDQEQQEQQAQAEQTEGEQGEEQQAVIPKDDGLTDEERQAMEQWLRRVPDDPGGLLRNKFNYEHYKRN